RLYHLKSYLRAWCIIMVLYQIANLGVGVYTYSWYGLAAWVSCTVLDLQCDVFYCVLRSLCELSYGVG
ncbi:uncharacterized protein DC041_0007676, partial [Schistosoma bovis]